MKKTHPKTLGLTSTRICLIDFPAKEDSCLPTEADIVRAILKHRKIKGVEHLQFSTGAEFVEHAWKAAPKVSLCTLEGTEIGMEFATTKHRGMLLPKN